ncbi:MAG TPA: hypothetical protein VFN13_04355 [Rudaea sp.]|nr:hypothetical protein [Rudaea sp.]
MVRYIQMYGEAVVLRQFRFINPEANRRGLPSRIMGLEPTCTLSARRQ